MADNILTASQTVTFDTVVECGGRLRIGQGEEPNRWRVFYDTENLRSAVQLAVSRGSFTPVGTPVSQDTVEYTEYAAVPDSELAWTPIINIKLGGLNYGVYSEDVVETYQEYVYADAAAALRCGECIEEEEEPPPAKAIAYAVYGSTNDPDADPCYATATADVLYQCVGPDLCEEDISVSVSGGDKNIFYVEFTKGFGPPVISIQTPGVSFRQLEEQEKYTSESIQSFERECALPDDGEILFQVKLDGLYYGFMRVFEKYPRLRYSYVLENEDGIPLLEPLPVSVFAYIHKDGCYASTNAVLELGLFGSSARSNRCWVKLEMEGKKLLHVTYGGSYLASSPTVRAVNATLEYMGVVETDTDNVVEFSEASFVPSGAIFSVKTREGYSGFKTEKTTTSARLYEVQPTDLEGKEPMFVYAYTDSGITCHGYDQLMLPPPNEEPQVEEHTAYQVASRIVITPEGAYAAPYSGFTDSTGKSFEDLLNEDGKPYLMVERVHESGYIHQFWRENYARVETTHYPHLLRHRLWEQTLDFPYLPDLVIKWTPPGLEGSADMTADTRPGGRRLIRVYNRLRNVNGKPTGVLRRWGNVRIYPEPEIPPAPETNP